MDSHAGAGGDDKWKLSKKGRSRSGRTPHIIMDGGGMLSRSYSASAASSSIRTRQQAASSSSCSSSSQQSHGGGGAGAGLSKKCVEAVKEHRARFYIVRRCVSMLVCWRDH